MDSTSLLQAGRPVEALAKLKEEVRSAPAQVELRVRLFALHCVLGKYDKALADLEAINSVDSSWALPAQLYQGLIRAEQLRREVFSGGIKPLLMGEPEAWVAWNVQAIALESQGKVAEAIDLRNQAWDAAPEYKCTVDGQECQWISDADRRLGPVLEAFLEGKYYWIPFGKLQKITITPPEFLVESVWVPATLTVDGGAELAAQIPARYPGSEKSEDGAICLGWKTEWVETASGSWPLGQKLFDSNATDFGLLSCKILDFQ